MQMPRLSIGVAAALFALSGQPASACQSGTQTYIQSGTYMGVTYTAISVNWDTHRVLVRQPNGTWVNPWPMTPQVDEEMFEALVENMLDREVSENC